VEAYSTSGVQAPAPAVEAYSTSRVQAPAPVIMTWSESVSKSLKSPLTHFRDAFYRRDDPTSGVNVLNKASWEESFMLCQLYPNLSDEEYSYTRKKICFSWIESNWLLYFFLVFNSRTGLSGTYMPATEFGKYNRFFAVLCRAVLICDISPISMILLASAL